MNLDYIRALARKEFGDEPVNKFANPNFADAVQMGVEEIRPTHDEFVMTVTDGGKLVTFTAPDGKVLGYIGAIYDPHAPLAPDYFGIVAYAR